MITVLMVLDKPSLECLLGHWKVLDGCWVSSLQKHYSKQNTHTVLWYCLSEEMVGYP